MWLHLSQVLERLHSLDGRRVSPLVLGSARAPPRLDLSLCFSLFLRSQILPLHRFFYIRRSVTPIGGARRRASKEERQPPYGGPMRIQGAPASLGRAPYLLAPSGTVSR